ncbi:hemerythrin domain-containing protein [uncultured Tateyamaria sp.]|uniref:hemerythrin domain-containing protein n=1 Tax=uncultured Tateyamaria sp. TaxID=455651 RepID=UPI0026084F51|nr:hemerythrin domain-containing protein [uncultured Tateyamaria sp.]
MNSATTEHRTTDGKTPTSVMLLRNPLDFIAEDHLRLRTMCGELDRLVEATGIEDGAITVMIENLNKELPLLLADEDHDLIPKVLSRAEPEDELPKLIERLEQEHAVISAHLKTATTGLAALVPATDMSDQLREAMRNLASATRRHLTLENAVLLPLARARLTKEDLHELRSATLRRRGLADLFSPQSP